MTEPHRAPIPCPANGAGWPMALFRVELTMAGAHTIQTAAFTLATVAREIRMGVITTYAGRELVAFPHQTVDAIVRSHMTERLLADGASVAALASQAAEAQVR